MPPFVLNSTAADLMDVFSRLPRDLNFIEHTSDMGWKAYVFSIVIKSNVQLDSIDDVND